MNEKKTPQARIKKFMNKWPNLTFEVGASIFMNRVHEQRASSLSNGSSIGWYCVYWQRSAPEAHLEPK